MGSSSKSRARLRLRPVGLPHILVGRVFFWKHHKKSAGPTEQRWSSSWARCRPTPEAASSCHSRATLCGAPLSLPQSCGSPQPTRRGRGRVNVCLEATEEVLAAVGSWEAAAAKMAAKQAPAMFGKPLTEAQLQERFQSCLKTSAQGVKFVKLKATLANVRFWDRQGKRTNAQGKANPGCSAASPAVGDESAAWAALRAAGRQAGRWRGRVPAIGKGSCGGLQARLSDAQQGSAGQPHRRASNFEHIAPRAPQNSFSASCDPEN